MLKPDSKLYVQDLVLYTKRQAHREATMIRDFVARNFPADLAVYYYGQSTVTGHNLNAELEILSAGRVRFNQKEMEVISRNDTLMTIAEPDSTKIPAKETELLLGQCMKLFNNTPQYRPATSCSSPLSDCTKYRKTYPVMISGTNYLVPVLQYAVVSNCILKHVTTSPEPNIFNEDIRNQIVDKDSLLVQIVRLPLISK